MEQLRDMPAAAIILSAELASKLLISPNGVRFLLPFRLSEEARATAEGQPVPEKPATIESFDGMVEAYENNDTIAFNEAVDELNAAVAAYPIVGYSSRLVSLERWMQASWPTGVAMILYLVTLVLGLIYFAINLPRLRQAVWGMLLIAFIVHTVAIVYRCDHRTRP